MKIIIFNFKFIFYYIQYILLKYYIFETELGDFQRFSQFLSIYPISTVGVTWIYYNVGIIGGKNVFWTLN